MPAGIEDEELSAASTDEKEIQDGSASGEDQSADTADSSSAKGDGPDDLLSVVRDVVDSSRAEGSPPRDEEQAGKPGDSQKQQAQDGDDSYEDVPFNKHPRFRKLLTERNTFKVQAERSQNIEAFLRETGVTDAEAANALEVSALAKHNPAAAWERLRPWVQDLLVRAGEVVPDDLAKRVEAGELSREAAIELSKARAGVSSLEAQRKFESDQRAAQQAEQVRQARLGVVQGFYDSRMAADPLFEKKLPYLEREIAWRHRNGDNPDTPAGVQKQLEDVYAHVNKEYRGLFAPPPRQRQAIKPVMGGQGASADVKPQPKSVLDIVQQTREARASA